MVKELQLGYAELTLVQFDNNGMTLEAHEEGAEVRKMLVDVVTCHE